MLACRSALRLLNHLQHTSVFFHTPPLIRILMLSSQQLCLARGSACSGYVNTTPWHQALLLTRLCCPWFKLLSDVVLQLCSKLASSLCLALRKLFYSTSDPSRRPVHFERCRPACQAWLSSVGHTHGRQLQRPQGSPSMLLCQADPCRCKALSLLPQPSPLSKMHLSHFALNIIVASMA